MDVNKLEQLERFVTLYVTGLSKKVQSKDLDEVFQSFGRVYGARIIPTENSEYNYGFVEMDRQGAWKAFRANIMLDEHPLHVLYAKGKPSSRSMEIEQLKKKCAYWKPKQGNKAEKNPKSSAAFYYKLRRRKKPE